MSCNPTIAWKASLTRIPPPIGTSAPGSQFALNLKIVGAANDLVIARLISCATARGPLRVQTESTSLPQNRRRLSRYEGKGLKLRDESKRGSACHKILARIKKILIKYLRFTEPDVFQSADRRIAYKWLNTRIYFCSAE
jgi:hypothetical protein